MNPVPGIPFPDSIPAPPWVFHILEVFLFTIHLLFINIVLGGSIISFFSRLRNATSPGPLAEPLRRKLPVLFALAINVGVAPLLFVQVLYGNFFYTSSILMGRFWIMIVPGVIIAYYAAYVHSRTSTPTLGTIAIGITSAIALYVAFMFVNNMLMMMQPERWVGYFGHRAGTLLSTGDRTLMPRYLHFLTASIAIAALFSAGVWNDRMKRGNLEAGENVRRSLFIFGTATAIESTIGLWFLTSLKQECMMQFLGGDLVSTIILAVGLLCGIGSIGTAFMGNYRPTVIMAALTVAAMILTRDKLRTLYLQGTFDTASLQISEQHDVLVLFLLVLGFGLAAVIWMLKVGFAPSTQKEKA